MEGIEFKGKKVLKAEVISGVFTMPQFEFITSSDIEMEVEGMKRKQVQQMIHSYCPFCGVKIKKDKEEVSG